MKHLLLILLLLTSCGKSSSHETFRAKTLLDLTSKYDVPALGAGLLRSGQMEVLEVRGVRKVGFQSVAQEEDAFHLGSCTKAMTSTLAAVLIEDGKLKWTTTMEEIFPEYSLHPSFKTMTFETLLVHRGGLPVDEHTLFRLVTTMEPTSGRVLITKALLEREPAYSPGSEHRYSNFNYIIAGHALEKISGKSWELLLAEKIFAPLEMGSCGFGVTSRLEDGSPSTIWAHERTNGATIAKHFDNPLTFGPASTVHCSLRDWGKFLSIHVKGFNGESSFLKSETFKKLHSPHPSKDSSYTYGGWNLLQRNWAGGPVLTHNGSNLLNYSVVWIAPKKNAALMGTTNIGGEDAFRAADDALQLMISQHLP